jgi:hypothetical protein
VGIFAALDRPFLAAAGSGRRLLPTQLLLLLGQQLLVLIVEPKTRLLIDSMWGHKEMSSILADQ